VNVTGTPTSKNIIPTGFYLEQNNPNPFNKLTTIKFNLPQQAKVTIVITNSYGRVVDKLISSVRDAGSYELKFLAEGLPKGTYFYHVVADKFSESREMELTK
jgi:5-hydroxyisourate hydrolase-like protein (transthyretin family)